MRLSDAKNRGYQTTLVSSVFLGTYILGFLCYNLFLMISLSVPVYARQNFVDNLVRASEPSVCAYRLSSEFKYEFAEMITPERQSNVHEYNVAAVVVIGILYCVPYSHGVGVQQGKAFPQECRIPQIGIPVIECTCIAADGLVLVFCYEHPGIFAFLQSFKERDVRHVTPWFHAAVAP